MAKWYGRVGYGHSVEDPEQRGVWEDVITERKLYGDVQRITRRLEIADKVNSDLTTSNSISIMADSYALENIFALRYVEWMGALWTISEVEEQRPRLILRLGGVYNGPTPATSGNSGEAAAE